MNFGQILRTLREERGIYQKELASYLNVSISTISNYENGVHFPDFELLSLIADFFGVTADYLIGRTKFPYDISVLDNHLTEDYSVTDLVNTVLTFSSRESTALKDYVEFLQLRQKQ